MVREKKAGKERLSAVLSAFDPAIARADLGDPVAGATIYRVCIYDQGDTLAGELVVDRAGEPCGRDGKACWKAIRDKGFAYRDATRSSDGIKRLVAKGGKAGKGKIKVKGGNKARKGYTQLPTGLAAALAGSERATLQIVTSDAGCFATTLDRVKKSDEMLFKARRH